MPNILTSWKEIGQYLGKGVRTVQRWEREAGLPVRRRENSTRHGVLAIPEELDDWARSRTRGPSAPMAEFLRREMAVLRLENSELRMRMEAMEEAILAVTTDEVLSANSIALARKHRLAESASAHRSRATPLDRLPEDGDLRRQSGQLRLAARQQRTQMIRSRLTFLFTLCSATEQSIGNGKKLAALMRAKQSAQDLRRCLGIPGYVAQSELAKLSHLLEELLRRIAVIEEEPASRRNR